MTEPPFLSLMEILDIHRESLKRFGGVAGLRDADILNSALSMPRATFAGKFLHPFPFGMAAAYAYHIAENQPFFDGNKRTGLAAALVFLELCRISINDPKGRLHDVMIAVGKGKATKGDVAELLSRLAGR